MRFEMFIGMIIMLNCITIGLQTNMKGEPMFVISLMDNVFTCVFLIEAPPACGAFGFSKLGKL